MSENKFAVRGYIEGYYGKPWTEEQRVEMLEYMSSLGENAYYYAPKDDPYHRKLWRKQYPEKELAALKRIVDKAAQLGVTFHYCIAPGLSMRYSSEMDFYELCQKTRALFGIGISNFGLLLDDIPEELFFPEDKAEFGETVNAHITLCKRYMFFIKTLSKRCHLTVCPLQYHGKGTEDYIKKFASSLPGEISVFFTGADICSKELTVREAEEFYKVTGHKPLYWDNFPVNDAEMFKEMHLAPLKGREPGLYKYSEGIISNCMEYFECNKFPLYTAAAYLSDPLGYDPEKAFSAAVEKLVPADVRDSFFLFADHLRTSCLNDENSRIMGEYLGKASVMRETGNEENALALLTEYTDRVRSSVNVLKKQDAPLYKELSEWLEKYYLMADILDEALAVLKGEGDREKLTAQMKKYNDCATVLTSFCFREYIESVLQ